MLLVTILLPHIRFVKYYLKNITILFYYFFRFIVPNRLILIFFGKIFFSWIPDGYFTQIKTRKPYMFDW